jgi:hypothetical protein
MKEGPSNMRTNSCHKGRFYRLTWQLLLGLLILASALAATGCWNRPGQDAEELHENERIMAKVKVALIQEPGLDAAPLDIKIHNGVVTLEGFLEDESQRQQATQAAQNVTEVRSVVNNIQIKEQN